MWLPGVLMGLVLAVPGPVSLAQSVAIDEEVAVASRTMTDRDFLRGDRQAGVPVVITGALHIPAATRDGPAPLVILLHGSDGPRSGAAWAWSQDIWRQGFATLRLDSFTARGATDVSTDQNQFGQFTQTYDVYRAIEAVAADPRIDANRVVVMGFSRGGTATLLSAMRRFEEAHGPGDLSIAGHLSFYPVCNFQLGRDTEITPAPIRVFHGDADDWTSAERCEQQVERLATAGADIRITVFPGARHAFDNPMNPSLFSLPDAQSSFACLRREVDHELINPQTGRVFDYADACVRRGTTIRYDEAASTAARAAVAAFLADIFRD